MTTHFQNLEDGNRNTCFNCCFCTRRERCFACVLVVVPILLIFGLAIVLIVNALLVTDEFERLELDPFPTLLNSSDEVILARAKRLGGGIKIKSVSYNSSHQETEEFVKLIKYINDTYPNIRKAKFITRYEVNTFSIIYRVEGTEITENPYMLCGHLDVVPEGNTERWEYDTFLGNIIEDNGEKYVYGRGAVDAKHSVFGILEVLEYIAHNLKQPKRTFYVAFGHDEEVGGSNGAGEIKKSMIDLLAKNEEKLDFILDEGTFVVKGMFPGVDDPLIVISVAEKGWATIDLKIEGEQTHSSMPPRESTIGVLANAVSNLEKYRQPSRFGQGPEYDTVRYAAAHANFGYKIVMGNLWLFSSLISSRLGNKKVTDAMQRTTTAVTVVRAGLKENIIPGVATAVINHRIHPADTLEMVLQHDMDTIDDERVNLTVRRYFDPPKVSPYSSDSIPFQVIANSALDVYPEAKVVPSILVGNTDTIHYVDLCDRIYRFSPMFMIPQDVDRFHGIDERINVKTYDKVGKQSVKRLKDTFEFFLSYHYDNKKYIT